VASNSARSNAGGPAALTAAAARAHGLRIVRLTDATVAELRACAPVGADCGNPIDLTPHATARHYRDVLERVLADDDVDAVLALYVPPLVEHAPDIAAAIVEAATSAPGKPLLASYLSRAGVDPVLTRDDRIVPTFAWPESAAVALGRVANYARWRSAPGGVVRELPDIDRASAELLVREQPPGQLDLGRATALLGCFGIPSATASDTAAEGRDTVVTVSADPVFGPIVSFGVAGDYIDLFGDVGRRITPLSDRDAAELVRSIRAFPLLSGERGGPAYDVSAVEETLLRVSTLVEFLPQVSELELRLRVLVTGAVAVSARICLDLA
jgi:acyl-CoA synthetase (NDP forming)